MSENIIINEGDAKGKVNVDHSRERERVSHGNEDQAGQSRNRNDSLDRNSNRSSSTNRANSTTASSIARTNTDNHGDVVNKVQSKPPKNIRKSSFYSISRFCLVKLPRPITTGNPQNQNHNEDCIIPWPAFIINDFPKCCGHGNEKESLIAKLAMIRQEISVSSQDKTHSIDNGNGNGDGDDYVDANRQLCQDCTTAAVSKSRTGILLFGPGYRYRNRILPFHYDKIIFVSSGSYHFGDKSHISNDDDRSNTVTVSSIDKQNYSTIGGTDTVLLMEENSSTVQGYSEAIRECNAFFTRFGLGKGNTESIGDIRLMPPPVSRLPPGEKTNDGIAIDNNISSCVSNVPNKCTDSRHDSTKNDTDVPTSIPAVQDATSNGDRIICASSITKDCSSIKNRKLPTATAGISGANPVSIPGDQNSANNGGCIIQNSSITKGGSCFNIESCKSPPVSAGDNGTNPVYISNGQNFTDNDGCTVQNNGKINVCSSIENRKLPPASAEENGENPVSILEEQISTNNGIHLASIPQAQHDGSRNEEKMKVWRETKNPEELAIFVASKRVTSRIIAAGINSKHLDERRDDTTPTTSPIGINNATSTINATKDGVRAICSPSTFTAVGDNGSPVTQSTKSRRNLIPTANVASDTDSENVNWNLLYQGEASGTYNSDSSFENADDDDEEATTVIPSKPIANVNNILCRSPITRRCTKKIARKFDDRVIGRKWSSFEKSEFHRGLKLFWDPHTSGDDNFAKVMHERKLLLNRNAKEILNYASFYFERQTMDDECFDYYNCDYVVQSAPRTGKRSLLHLVKNVRMLEDCQERAADYLEQNKYAINEDVFTEEEHNLFLDGVKLLEIRKRGLDTIAEEMDYFKLIPTRSVRQIMNYAHSFFEKQQKPNDFIRRFQNNSIRLDPVLPLALAGTMKSLREQQSPQNIIRHAQNTSKKASYWDTEHDEPSKKDSSYWDTEHRGPRKRKKPFWQTLDQNSDDEIVTKKKRKKRPQPPFAPTLDLDHRIRKGTATNHISRKNSGKWCVSAWYPAFINKGKIY